MQLRVAEVDLLLTSEESDLSLSLPGITKRFGVEESPSEADIRLGVAWASGLELKELAQNEVAFDSGGLWKLHRASDRALFSCASPVVCGGDPYSVAIFDQDYLSGKVLLNRDHYSDCASVYPVAYPLDELCFTNYLALGRGTEVHACGAVDADGAARVFLGVSGAGKTTLARRLRSECGLEILSDDRIIIRRNGSGFRVFGTPWHGEGRFALPDGAPLAELYLLEQGPRFELMQLEGAAAIAKLMTVTFMPRHSREGVTLTVSFLEEILDVVPFYRLQSNLDCREIRERFATLPMPPAGSDARPTKR